MRIIGDIHADFSAYEDIIKDCESSIQVGDYGHGFANPPENLRLNHRFIRGNHDDPDLCKLDPHWIKDGTVATGTHIKENMKFSMMFIGGAWSIDRGHRTPGLDWWFNEELNDGEFQEIYDKYTVVKPQVVISHDLPYLVNTTIVNNSLDIKTRTGMWLTEMFNVHQPNLWICGHYHMYRSQIYDKCRFIVLPINGWMDFDWDVKYLDL